MQIEQQQRIEDTTKRIVNEIDTEFLRKMQAVMHRCAARCCEDTTSSMETVHRCIQNCSVPLTEAQNFVQEEFSSSQVEHSEYRRRKRHSFRVSNLLANEISFSTPIFSTLSDVYMFQSRLHRCVLECNDSIKDKMGASPTESEVKRYNMDFENCAVKCVDKHVEQLPTLMKRMKEVLKKRQQQSAYYYPS